MCLRRGTEADQIVLSSKRMESNQIYELSQGLIKVGSAYDAFKYLGDIESYLGFQDLCVWLKLQDMARLSNGNVRS